MPKLSLAKLERHLLGAADRLRQEGLDAATYKDYIFGLLFLKRCSDQFDGERERLIQRKVAQGVIKDEAERRYGENPDFFDTFFVPERARWSYLQSKLNDAAKPFGSRLDEALAALSESNDSLSHVLDHIQFQRMQGNKRVVGDDACKDLVRHFSKHRLRNEDFQFSDLLGSAQSYLRPEDIEKIVTAYKRFEDLEAYARVVPVSEIGDPANDWNLNIRRYVDNAPPPEPQDVRAHLHGGVPVGEVEAKRHLFDAIGLDPAKLFVSRDVGSPGSAGFQPPQTHLGRYLDFAPALAERATIRPLIEQDPGVQARLRSVHDRLAGWWSEHAPRLASLSERRNLNAVRAEILASFVEAMQPLRALDHFKLAGVVAAWWTDGLADLKTLMERGFAGVIEGWIDAIADALEDDDSTGPAFDPFSHKLVLATMADYLERISETRAEVARLKADKAAVEADNAPDDLDEEDLANWNQAKDLERQAKELRAEHREPLKEHGKLGTTIDRLKAQIQQPVGDDARARTSARKREEQLRAAETRRAELEARLAPVFAELKRIAEALEPYKETIEELAAARKRYRELLADFLDELRARCGAMINQEQAELVLRLFEGDLRSGLGAALADRRARVVRFAEAEWDKYRDPLKGLREARNAATRLLDTAFGSLGYA